MTRSLRFLATLSATTVLLLTSFVSTAFAQIYQRGDRGVAVQDIQRELGIPADGVYGELTESAVTRFQRSRGLQCIDGIAGPETLSALGLSDLTSFSSSPCGSLGAFSSRPNPLLPSSSLVPLVQLAGASETGNYEVAIPGNSYGGSIEQLRQEVRDIVPNASFGDSSRGAYVRAGRYETASGAESVSELLRARGFDARVIRR